MKTNRLLEQASSALLAASMACAVAGLARLFAADVASGQSVVARAPQPVTAPARLAQAGSPLPAQPESEGVPLPAVNTEPRGAAGQIPRAFRGADGSTRSSVNGKGQASQVAPLLDAVGGTDLNCSVENWESTPQKPVLTLACPPVHEPTPVRVHLKLSWMELRDRPEYFPDIVAKPRMATRLRSDSRGAFVWLKVQPTGAERPRVVWVAFNELVNLEVLSEE